MKRKLERKNLLENYYVFESGSSRVKNGLLWEIQFYRIEDVRKKLKKDGLLEDIYSSKIKKELKIFESLEFFIVDDVFYIGLLFGKNLDEIENKKINDFVDFFGAYLRPFELGFATEFKCINLNSKAYKSTFKKLDFESTVEIIKIAEKGLKNKVFQDIMDFFYKENNLLKDDGIDRLLPF